MFTAEAIELAEHHIGYRFTLRVGAFSNFKATASYRTNEPVRLDHWDALLAGRDYALALGEGDIVSNGTTVRFEVASETDDQAAVIEVPLDVCRGAFEAPSWRGHVASWQSVPGSKEQKDEPGDRAEIYAAQLQVVKKELETEYQVAALLEADIEELQTTMAAMQKAHDNAQHRLCLARVRKQVLDAKHDGTFGS